MDMVIGILLLLTFVGFIVYAVKGGNMMIGFLVMAIIWTALGIIGGEITWADAQTKFSKGDQRAGERQQL